MTLQRVPINNFRGGLNTRDSPFELQANESPDLQNVTVSALVGQLEARKGKVRLDVSGMPAEAADYMKQVVIGTTKRFLMMSINGGIWQLNPAGVATKLHAGTAGTIWDFELYADAAGKDWVYCSNGVDAVQKWDGEAGATVVWPTTLGTIPVGGVLTVWEDRMFISNVAAHPARVYFSEFGDPEATLKEYGFVDIRGPEDDSDAVQDLCVLGSRLIVLKRRSVYYISNSVTMLNRRIGSPGVWSRFQVAELEDKLYFLNPQGIFTTGGVTVAMESGSINNYFPNHVSQNHLDKARLMVTRDTYPRLLVALPIDKSVPNNVLIEMVPHINFRRIGGRRYLLLPAFFKHTLPLTSLAPWNPTGTEEIMVGSAEVAFDPKAEPGASSFVRAMEKAADLANGGATPAWVTQRGQIGLFAGIGKIPSYAAWITQGEVVQSTGFIVEEGGVEITEPSVQVHVHDLDNSANGNNIAVFSCVPASLAHTGYFARWTWVSGTKTWTLTIEKWTAGVKVTLLTVTGLANVIYTDFGMSVVGGKVRAFAKVGGAWVLHGEVADAAFNKGLWGAEFLGLGWGLQKLGAGITPTGSGRVSQLFKGETDEGKVIESYWHSSWMAIQGEEPKERLRRLNVELSGDVEVDVYKDFEPNPAFTAKLPFKEGPEEEGREYRFTRVRPETRGRFHAVRFRSVAGSEPFLINTAELVIRGGKEH